MIYIGIITILILLLIIYILHIRSNTQLYKLHDQYLLKCSIPDNSEAIYNQLALNANETHPLKQLFGNHIYCICLASRQDRYDNVCKQLEKIGLSASDITFYRPEKDLRGGQVGCWQSHRAINKLGFDSGAEFWLCFEDDLLITDQYEQAIENLRNFLPTNAWHIINLHNAGINKKNIDDNFYYGYGICMAAYVMNRDYFQYCGFDDGLITPAYGHHCDMEIYVNTKSPVYTPYVVFSHVPFISIDSDSPSDNNLPVMVNILKSVVGHKNLYKTGTKIGNFINNIDEYLMRYILLKNANHV
jgi:hypothetical protein